MSTVMRCPRCRSTDIECQPKRRGHPHMHICHSCGYDGTTVETAAETAEGSNPAPPQPPQRLR